MVPLEFPITPRRSKEEDIYEDLCYVTLRIPEVPTACPLHDNNFYVHGCS